MSPQPPSTPIDESFLDGEHALFLEQVYQQYLQDPGSIASTWRDYFTALESPQTRQIPAGNGSGGYGSAPLADPPGLIDSSEQQRNLQARVLRLINSYRYLGHLAADTNPLGDYAGNRMAIPELDLEHHGLENVPLDTVFDPGSFNIDAQPTLGNIHKALKETYVRTLGFEYMHILNVQEKRWLQQRIEPNMAHDELDNSKRLKLLKQLTAAEGFEQYLHRRYVGQKRFGLEGGESLIPLMHTLIQESGKNGLQETVIGMAHRGRLNVLINVMCKPPFILFDEFEGKVDDDEYTSDVKYHKGYSNDILTDGGPMHLALAFNPSHLEIVSPVVEGSVRSRQERLGDQHGQKAMGIIVHGDAAFAGQGVVMETFSMAQTRGYRTHGTVHIVLNNQIGFTTSTAADSRSTHYPTDAAKIINAPIIHVNGDDPEAVIYAARVALEYRNTFNKDVVIDLVCYRRLGHNEADEPAMTQPVMYKVIRQLATTRTQYAQKLHEMSVVSEEQSDALAKEFRELMDSGEGVDKFLDVERVNSHVHESIVSHWRDYLGGHWRNQVDTTFPAERIQQISADWLGKVPEDFVVHRRVKKVLEDRAAMGRGDKPADWGFGETLAYATLLEQGYNVRLSGQDCGRGTFSHRHAVLHHQERREQWIPLRHGHNGDAMFTVIDSLLSEEAVLAFEYGYATAEPKVLTIWEAQFGDFVNGAQVVIDQFISSGEQKWQRLCGLTMFLPHGFEGQGPEHSSARLERFMQLAAQQNMQISVPTTPAQIFHLLRQQMLRKYRRPLIVFTPKSLLRHPLATSQVRDFTEGKFEFVIDDVDYTSSEDRAAVTRLIICSGKVYYDLLEARRKHNIRHIGIVRLEQLYPFPGDELSALVAKFPNVFEKIWCQEEPVNQGAWDAIIFRFEEYCGWGHDDIRCVSRPPAAAPAVGSLKIHQAQQKALVNEALELSDD